MKKNKYSDFFRSSLSRTQASSERPTLHGARHHTRRHFLRLASHAALIGTMPSLCKAHGAVGTVKPPLPMPAISLTTQEGKRILLTSLLGGKATALQLMFTGCSQVCPLQGAMVSAVQTRLQEQDINNAQLVSISIDPLGDDARSLHAWLRKFGAGKQWIAAVPATKDMDALRKALGEANDRLDNHTGKIFLFDKRGLLVWRTEDLPSVDNVASQLVRIAQA